MATTQTALDLISSADLTPTEHLLLKHFVESAVDSERAARYLLSRVSQSDGAEDDTESSLRHFKRDLRKLITRLTKFDKIPKYISTLVRSRDGPRCFITKNEHGPEKSTVETAYVIPPSLLHNLESEEEGRLYAILESFLTPSYIGRLRDVLCSKNDISILQNVWLLSPSVHRAFRAGHVTMRTLAQVQGQWTAESEPENPFQPIRCCLQKSYPEECSGLFLGDGSEPQVPMHFFTVLPDKNALPLPSSFLFDVHYRLATALHLFSIEDKIARDWPRTQVIIELLACAVH
ncbi:hypothetical protein VTN96DRAFT_1281 [Rasamsonia emersonii]